MTDPKRDGGHPDLGVLGNRPRWKKALHIAFWTLLFYGMTAGLAKFLEWVDPAR
ncbi:hypothetical protein [Deferrisoma sp.]